MLMINYCFVHTINLSDLQCWFNKGTAGVEPATSRSAVECSTTELYPQMKNFPLVVHINIFSFPKINISKYLGAITYITLSKYKKL